MIYLYLFFKYYPTQNMFQKFPKIENKIQIFLCQLQILFSGRSQCNISSSAQSESSSANNWKHRAVRTGQETKEIKTKERGLHLDPSIAASWVKDTQTGIIRVLFNQQPHWYIASVLLTLLWFMYNRVCGDFQCTGLDDPVVSNHKKLFNLLFL